MTFILNDPLTPVQVRDEGGLTKAVGVGMGWGEMNLTSNSDVKKRGCKLWMQGREKGKNQSLYLS